MANYLRFTNYLLSRCILNAPTGNSNAITVRFVGNLSGIPGDKPGKRETAGEMDLIELLGSKEEHEGEWRRAHTRKREREREGGMVTSLRRREIL